MAIALEMHPGEAAWTWQRFCDEAPPYSIALDGFVGDGPRFDASGPRLNLNHHENVDRLATRATCGQVLISIRQGLFERFSERGNPSASIYVNDCDEDVCASYWLLANNSLARSVVHPTLNRFVAIVELLDTTAGAYPFPTDTRTMQELEWVFQPYRSFRAVGGLDSRDPDSFAGIITDVGHRIMGFVTGRAERIELDTRYEVLRREPGWVMLVETGLQGRVGAFRDGVTAYVIARERGDGRWAYTVGRISPFIQFDVPAILAALDREEGNASDHWGGGNTIGGSPRASGSRLDPDRVAEIVAATATP